MSKTEQMPLEQLAPADSLNWTDARIVRGCLDGNQEAWSALIQKYKNLIFSVPIKYGFSQEEAADVFQTACLELLSQMPNIREPRALPNWILTVVSHVSYHRKHNGLKTQTKSDELIRWFEKGMPAEAEEIAQQAKREQALRGAISELALQCRQLVHMLFFEASPRPHSQIAKELSLVSGSIGFTRQRCLGRLRGKLSSANI